MLSCSIVAAALGAEGCASRPPKVTSAVETLPPFTAEDAALFGNTLSRAVFGRLPDPLPAEDPKLTPRVQQADFVVAGKISTVSREKLAGADIHSLRVVVRERPLKGPAPEGDGALDLVVPRGTAGAIAVESRGVALAGQRLILFCRRFQEGGEPSLRWHGEADTEEIRRLVSGARTSARTPLDARPGPSHTPR